MKSRFAGVLMGQVLGLVLVCAISSFTALVSFGGIAGVTMASAPERVFRLAAPLSCPDGTIRYEEFKASYHRPGERSFYVECVKTDGSAADITSASIGYSLLGFYLACFLPLCLPGAAFALVLPLFLLRGEKQKQPPIFP
ncbi:MAG: hypothetical protein LDL50_00630 [Chloroflexi bacterium]|nr:hypothetical protein [Chloroflexota bacterium]MCA2000731.1 hypothetical protein [Chloroflexota bacterium]